MDQFLSYREDIRNDGFTVIDDVFTDDEVKSMIAVIDSTDQSNLTFRKTEDLFAIRRFLIEMPEIRKTIFNHKLKQLISNLFGDDYFVVKSIYFDKPEKSNWFVAWHQDLTISVDKKAAIPGYGPWTVKPGQFAVQPPVEILRDNFTIRIHLDDTDKGNGALKVIPGSHLRSVYRADDINFKLEKEEICEVRTGGLMIIRPLLMHASNRTTNQKRRVIHIEFSRSELPEGLNWAEKDFF